MNKDKIKINAIFPKNLENKAIKIVLLKLFSIIMKIMPFLVLLFTLHLCYSIQHKLLLLATWSLTPKTILYLKAKE
jgi:hypothetical protein